MSTAFGEKLDYAEPVAYQLIDQARRYVGHYSVSVAAVGEDLGDQQMLPLTLGNGGLFTMDGASLHARTNAQVTSDICRRACASGRVAR